MRAIRVSIACWKTIATPATKTDERYILLAQIVGNRGDGLSIYLASEGRAVPAQFQQTQAALDFQIGIGSREGE